MIVIRERKMKVAYTYPRRRNQRLAVSYELKLVFPSTSRELRHHIAQMVCLETIRRKHRFGLQHLENPKERTKRTNPHARLHPSQLCLIHFDGNLCAFVENLNLARWLE